MNHLSTDLGIPNRFHRFGKRSKSITAAIFPSKPLDSGLIDRDTVLEDIQPVSNFEKYSFAAITVVYRTAGDSAVRQTTNILVIKDEMIDNKLVFLRCGQSFN